MPREKLSGLTIEQIKQARLAEARSELKETFGELALQLTAVAPNALEDPRLQPIINAVRIASGVSSPAPEA